METCYKRDAGFEGHGAGAGGTDFFPTDHGAPLFPSCYFFCLLMLQTPPDGCRFSKNTVLAAEVID